MAKTPRKALGFKYEVTAENDLFYVDGPGLNDLVRCNRLDDAEMIAAALNFSTNYDLIKSQAQKIASAIDYLNEFK